MQCRKCGREFSSKMDICIYCGASIGSQASSRIKSIVCGVSSISISDEQDEKIKLKDLPEQVRHKIEDAIRKGKDEVIVKEESRIVQSPLATANRGSSSVSFEKILTLLANLSDSFNAGNIEYGDYERMAEDMIKDYISTLADDTKLDFVISEIMDSGLSDYLNEEMLKDLRAFVLSSISDEAKW